MDSTTTSAIIAAIAAIIVATISATVAVISARRSAQATLELETYKDMLQQYRQHDAFSKEMALKRVEILGQACSALQRVKDNLRDLQIQAEPSPSVEEIAQACDEIVELYATSHFMLPSPERRALHDIKNTAKRVVNVCNRVLDGKPELVCDLAGFLDSFESAHTTLIREYDKWQDLSMHGEEAETGGD